MGMGTLHIRFAEEHEALVDKLQVEARRHGVPVSTYARSLLVQALSAEHQWEAEEVLNELERNPPLLNRLRRLIFCAPE